MARKPHKIKGKSYICLNCGSVWEPGDKDYHRARGMLVASLHERCPHCRGGNCGAERDAAREMGVEDYLFYTGELPGNK